MKSKKDNEKQYKLLKSLELSQKPSENKKLL